MAMVKAVEWHDQIDSVFAWARDIGWLVAIVPSMKESGKKKGKAGLGKDQWHVAVPVKHA